MSRMPTDCNARTARRRAIWIAALATTATAAAAAPTAAPGPAAPAPPDRTVAEAAAFRSRDGRTTFRVPQPGDREWADYQEMLRHPAYRSSGEGKPGYALPYDPEWRALVRGRRDAPEVDIALGGASRSLEALARSLLAALAARDGARLVRLHVTRDEFLGLCWPEFPQSRPYLKIPEDEAWSFQAAQADQATVSALHEFGGRAWTLRAVRSGKHTDYRNFTLHEDVTILAADASGEVKTLHVAPVVVERRGRFKVFSYGD